MPPARHYEYLRRTPRQDLFWIMPGLSISLVQAVGVRAIISGPPVVCLCLCLTLSLLLSEFVLLAGAACYGWVHNGRKSNSYLVLVQKFIYNFININS